MLGALVASGNRQNTKQNKQIPKALLGEVCARARVWVHLCSHRRTQEGSADARPGPCHDQVGTVALQRPEKCNLR